MSEAVHESGAALARAVGLKRQQVSKLLKLDSFPDSLSEVEFRLAYEQYQTVARRGPPPKELRPASEQVLAVMISRRPASTSSGSKSNADDRLRLARAEQAELDLKERLGELVSRDSIADQQLAESRALLIELSDMPDRVLEECVELGPADRDRVHQLITEQVGLVRDRLSGQAPAVAGAAFVEACVAAVGKRARFDAQQVTAIREGVSEQLALIEQ